MKKGTFYALAVCALALTLGACGGGSSSDSNSTSSTTHPYQGTWKITYTGAADNGTCPALVVTSEGKLSGDCNSEKVGAFKVTGDVT